MKVLLIVLLGFSFSEPFDGLTLITNMAGGGQGGNSPRESRLVDNNQNNVNVWTHDTGPASIAYLTPDSILYVPCKVGGGGNAEGGRFKKMNWDGEIIWDYYLSHAVCIPHHDIAVLPNGNILAICSEMKTQEEAISAGRQNLNGPMTMDMIVEIEPIGSDEANIVWEWHFWDHLVQDINSFSENYGVLSENPQLLDINSGTGGGGGNNGPGISDWNHSNCISYHPEFNQIIISSRHMNEFYVIDHSTTTEEAASHSGGNYGVGGDFLYRWGNPQNYNMGNTQILVSQHGVNWIPEGFPGAGKIILFNNNHSNGNSAVFEIDLPMNDDGSYYLNENGFFGPAGYDWIYQPTDLYSNTQSGAFRLPNGNTLITSTNQNNVFEVNELGEVQWTYEGDIGTARAIKYSYDYFSPQITGDINEDSEINILDVVILVNIILGSDSSYGDTDINNDGSTDILDVVLLINIILEI